MQRSLCLLAPVLCSSLLWGQSAPSASPPNSGASAPKTDSAPASGRAVGKSGFDQIEHIVFIIKENHSFDNYFGTFPGANGATSGTISTGQVIPLGHTPDE